MIIFLLLLILILIVVVGDIIYYLIINSFSHHISILKSVDTTLQYHFDILKILNEKIGKEADNNGKKTSEKVRNENS